MPGHDIITIGFSAGGIEPLVALVRALPEGFAGSVFVVHHFPRSSSSALPTILSRRSPLPVAEAVEGESVLPGRVYVGATDRHLLLRNGRTWLGRGPRENGHRPAIDALFRSAAHSYGPRVVGVLLSGNLDDGAAGLQVIKRRGGVAIVQDPQEALFESMPRNAISGGRVDHVAPVAEIARLLARYVDEPVEEEAIVSNSSLPDPGESGLNQMNGREHDASASAFTCPECGGAMWELRNGDLVRFACHVGHVYTEESLRSEHDEALESALWTALRALRENSALARRLAERAERRGDGFLSVHFRDKEKESELRANIIQRVLTEDPRESEIETLADPPAPAEAQDR